MAGDRARVSYDPTRKWRGAVAQQGRVTIEADLNEAAMIADERDRQTTLDVVGPVGTPDGGYAVTAVTSEGDGGIPGDLTIGPGTLYLGGERLDLDAAVTYSTQPDWLDHSTDPLWVDPAIPEADLAFELITLHAAEIETSATEDPTLADVALGGPDTMQRRRILQRFLRRRVKLHECGEAWKEYVGSLAGQGLGFDPESMMLTSTTSLQVSFTNTPGPPSLCEPVATGGYLGAENQLIRVMIASVDGNGVPTLVWGFDNASFLYRLSAATYDAGANVTTVTLVSSPVDSFHFPALGQAVELLRDAVQLTATDYIAAPAGYVSALTAAYDPTTMQLVISGQPPGDYLAATPQLYLRVWQATVAAPVGQAVALGDTGLAVTLSSDSNAFNIGDFWTFAVRPIDPAVVYPARYLDGPQPPEGPRTWACPLAVVAWEGREAIVSSCVPPFDNLVKLTTANSCGCTLNVGPADVAGGAGLPALVAGLANRGPVSICLQPGSYTLSDPIVIGAGLDAVTLRGCDDGVVLAAASPAGPQFTLGLIVVQGVTGSIAIENITLAVPTVAFTPSADAFSGLPAANQQLMAAFSNGLSVAIGISSTDATGLTVRDCAFDFSQASTAGNVFGAGVYSTGMEDSFELLGCTFVGSRDPDVAPFYDLTAGNQTEPPFVLLFGFLQVPGGVIGTDVGSGSLPQLHDAAIERCRFEAIAVPVLSMAQIGTVRIDQNTVRDCYGGFWLISLLNQASVTLFDQIAVGNAAFFLDLSRFGLSALLERIIAMSTAMGRVLPQTPPPDQADIVWRIRTPSRRQFTEAQRIFGAIYSAAAAGAGVSQPAAGKPAAGEAAARPEGFTFIVNPRAFVPTEVIIPTTDPGTSVTMRLDIRDCQVDAVIANSYSGAGLMVVDLSQSRGSALVHGCRVRSRFPLGETVFAWLLTEATVTGNIIANEVTPANLSTSEKVPNSYSMTLAATVPYGVPAVAVTGNVFIDPMIVFPGRPQTIPPELMDWAVLNTVIGWPPIVTGISPTTGSTDGGDSVTISGSGFTNAREVDFGSTAATITGAVTDSSITVTSPPGSAGVVDVTVITPGGTSLPTPADQFTYVAPPPPGAAAKASSTAASSAAASSTTGSSTTAPKTPRTTGTTARTSSTAETRIMQRPDLSSGPPAAKPDEGGDTP